jgi:hypothetical protein
MGLMRRYSNPEVKARLATEPDRRRDRLAALAEGGQQAVLVAAQRLESVHGRDHTETTKVTLKQLPAA